MRARILFLPKEELMEAILFDLIILGIIVLFVVWMVMKRKNTVTVSGKNMKVVYRDIKRSVKKQAISKVLFLVGIITLGLGMLYFVVLIFALILSAFDFIVMFSEPYGDTPIIDSTLNMITMAGIPYCLLCVSVYVLEVRAIIINVKCRKVLNGISNDKEEE